MCVFLPTADVLYKQQWPTVEHYFQSRKFAGTKSEEEVVAARTAMEDKHACLHPTLWHAPGSQLARLPKWVESARGLYARIGKQLRMRKCTRFEIR